MIVVNTTFRLAPWADALMAMDLAWWQVYLAEVDRDFGGTRYSTAVLPPEAHAVRVEQRTLPTYGNSGGAAVSLALAGEATRVLLLGYDCMYADDGRRHWHGDHPAQLGNAGRTDGWIAKFEKCAVAAAAAGVAIVNCSRRTALTMFPRMDLDEALA